MNEPDMSDWFYCPIWGAQISDPISRHGLEQLIAEGKVTNNEHRVWTKGSMWLSVREFMGEPVIESRWKLIAKFFVPKWCFVKKRDASNK